MDKKAPNSNRKNNSNKIYFDSKINSFFIDLPDQREDILQKLESDLFHFLWNKKTDKIWRKKIVQWYKNGGLNMVHLKSLIRSMKITWIKRLLSYNSIWTSIFEEGVKVKKELLFTLGAEFPKDIAKNTRDWFCKGTLNTFSQFREINRNIEREEVFVHQELCPFPILIENGRVHQLLWCEKSQSSWRYFHVFPYQNLICFFSIWWKEEHQ